MIKYVTKFDEKHKNYKPIICTSNGIGNNYKASPSEIAEDKYRTEKGYKLTQPIYYRNKIYTESEREELWIKKLDENIRYIGSNKVKIIITIHSQFNNNTYVFISEINHQSKIQKE